MQRSPLNNAVLGNHVDIVRLLLARQDIDVEADAASPLIAASDRGNFAIIASAQRCQCQQKGSSGVHRDWKCHRFQYVRIVRLLLSDPRIDVNDDMEIGLFGYYGTLKAFSLACSQHGSPSMVNLALERPEAKQKVLNLQNQDVSTPLSTEMRDNNAEIVRLLLG